MTSQIWVLELTERKGTWIQNEPQIFLNWIIDINNQINNRMNNQDIF